MYKNGCFTNALPFNTCHNNLIPSLTATKYDIVGYNIDLSAATTLTEQLHQKGQVIL